MDKKNILQQYHSIKNITSNDMVKNSYYSIYNSFINNLDLGFYEHKEQIVIENCIIENFLIDNAWFLKGLILKNNIIKNKIEYNMGGHNKDAIFIENNIFHDFFDFFDCHFENMVVVKNNIFLKGSTLLGNKGKGYENIFRDGIILENNIGNISLNDSDIINSYN